MLLRCLYLVAAAAGVWSTPLQQGRPWILAPTSSSSTYSLVAPPGGYARLLTSLEAPLKDLTLSAWVNVTTFTDGVSPILTYVMPQDSRQVSFFLRHDGLGVLWGGPRTDIVPYSGVLVDRRPRMHWNLEETEGFVEDATGSVRKKREAVDYSGGLGDIVDILDLGRRQGRQNDRWTPSSFVDVDEMGVADLMADASELHLLRTRADYSRSESYNDWTNVPYELHMLESGGGGGEDPYDQHLATRDFGTQPHEPIIITRPTGDDDDFVFFNWNPAGAPKVQRQPLGENQWSPMWDEEPKLPDPKPSPAAEKSERADDGDDGIGGKWSSQVTEVRLGPNHWNPFTSVVSNSFSYAAPPSQPLQHHIPVSHAVPPPSLRVVPPNPIHTSIPPSTRPAPNSPNNPAPPSRGVSHTRTSPPDSKPRATLAPILPLSLRPTLPPRPTPHPAYNTQPQRTNRPLRTTLPPGTTKSLITTKPHRTTHSPPTTQAVRTPHTTRAWESQTTQSPRTTRPPTPFSKVTMTDDVQTTVSQPPTTKPETQTTLQPQTRSTAPSTSPSTTTMPTTQEPTTQITTEKSTTRRTTTQKPSTKTTTTQSTTITTTTTTTPPPTTTPYSRYTTLRFTAPPRFLQSDQVTLKSVVRQQTMRTPLWKRIKQPPMPKFTTNAPSTSISTPKLRTTIKQTTSRTTKLTTTPTPTTTTTTERPPRPAYQHQGQQDSKHYVTGGKSKVSIWSANNHDEQKANKHKWTDRVRAALASNPSKDASVEITPEHMDQFMRVLSAPPTVTDGNKAVVYSIPITDEKAFYAMYQKYQQETMATIGPKVTHLASPSDAPKAEEEINVNQLGSTGVSDNNDNANADIVYFHGNENKFDLVEPPMFPMMGGDSEMPKNPAPQPLPEHIDIPISEENTPSIHNHSVHASTKEVILNPKQYNKGHAHDSYTRPSTSQVDESLSRFENDQSFAAYSQEDDKAQEYSLEDEYTPTSHNLPDTLTSTETQNDNARPISYAGGSYSSYLHDAGILQSYNPENIAVLYRLANDEDLQFSHAKGSNPELNTKNVDLTSPLSDEKNLKHPVPEGQSPVNSYNGGLPTTSFKDVVNPSDAEEVNNDLPEAPTILDKGTIMSPAYSEELYEETDDPAFSSTVNEDNNPFSLALQEKQQSMPLLQLPSTMTEKDLWPSLENDKASMVDGEQQHPIYGTKGEEVVLDGKHGDRTRVEEEVGEKKEAAPHVLHHNQHSSKPTVYELHHVKPKDQAPRAPSLKGSHSRPEVPLIPRTTTRTPGRPSLPFERAPAKVNSPQSPPEQPTITKPQKSEDTDDIPTVVRKGNGEPTQQFNPAVAFTENLASLPPSHYQEVISLYHEEKPPTYVLPAVDPADYVPQPIGYGEAPRDPDRLEHDIGQVIYSEDPQKLIADGLLPRPIHTASSHEEAQQWMHQQTENSFGAPYSSDHNVDRVFVEHTPHEMNIPQESKPAELLPLETEAQDMPLSIHFKKVPYQFTPNKWFHVAFSWHSETRQMDIYVNGQLMGTLTETMLHTPDFPPNGLVILGQTLLPDLTQFDYTSNFIGEMSKVNIWPQALNQQDIRGLYQCAHYPPSARAMSWNDLSMRFYNGMHLKDLDSLCA